LNVEEEVVTPVVDKNKEVQEKIEEIEKQKQLSTKKIKQLEDDKVTCYREGMTKL
jgi:hypothetical protein